MSGFTVLNIDNRTVKRFENEQKKEGIREQNGYNRIERI